MNQRQSGSTSSTDGNQSGNRYFDFHFRFLLSLCRSGSFLQKQSDSDYNDSHHRNNHNVFNHGFFPPLLLT